MQLGTQVQAREYPHLWNKGSISEVLVNGYEVTWADGSRQVFLTEEVVRL